MDTEINQSLNKLSMDVKDYRKSYYERNKDRIRAVNLEAYHNNKDRRTELSKLYYSTHKEQLLEDKKQKTNCECGGCYTRTNKKTHLNSVKHLKFTEKQNNC